MSQPIPPPDPHPTQAMAGAPPSYPPPAEPPPTVAALTSSTGHAATIRLVLAIAVPALIVMGLAIPENDVYGYDSYTLWAVFATVLAAVHLAALFSPLSAEDTWTVVAAATAGLLIYWIAIVVPGISSNTGFLQTLGVALAVAHCCLLPGRRL